MVLFLQILGSLGVFLFGMKVLSEGIQKTAGEKMRSVMATMTQNRFAGLFTGLLTTSLLQSSSATTVIVVSFVNAGLLTLFESIGVIMGANLGTTVTAWIIAFVGKFSISKIAIPIVGIGLPFLFIGKDRWKHFGEVLIGFGLLFNGLGLLKKAVPDVKSMLKSSDPTDVANAEWIQNVVENLSGHGYGSILLFLFVGVLLTLIVQSSSAAMAITVTFAINGWIGFEESAAIVLGENIGTTVTAWLASLAANVNAKRAARAHFMFNILGILWMLLVFYLFTEMVQWLSSQLPDSFKPSDSTTDIGFSLAIFHTTFNLLNICVLIGFVPVIARIVEKWVKDKDSAGHSKMERLTYISKGLVDIGELSLPEAEKAVLGLGQRTESMFAGFLDVFNHPESDMSEQVSTLKLIEEESDQMLNDITQYLVKCSAAELSSENAAAVTGMLRISAELEEICDCTYRLVKLTQRKYEKQREFSPEMLDGIQKFAAEVTEFLAFCNRKLFKDVSMADVRKANELEISMDDQRKKLNNASVDRMQSQGDIKAEMLNIDINNHFELIGNHALNIIEAAHAISVANSD